MNEKVVAAAEASSRSDGRISRRDGLKLVVAGADSLAAAARVSGQNTR